VSQLLNEFRTPQPELRRGPQPDWASPASKSPEVMTARILLIEDEQSIADVLVYNLRKEGFEIVWERDGRDGLKRAQTDVPDLILLDLMLPGVDGLQVCRLLKGEARTRHVPLMMLTARSAETDEIVGFNMGADDYVTKPFRIQPLIQRVKALLRRSETGPRTRSVISLHGLQLDRTLHLASLQDKPLDLTPTEFRMLWTLMSQPGRPFSRNELLETSRGDDANALERTVDVHVRALRKKLGPAEDLIETVRGIGYRFVRR
jgi:two-component system phosphate regulon response regulator PhoB